MSDVSSVVWASAKPMSDVSWVPLESSVALIFAFDVSPVSNVNYFGRSATVILAGLELSLVFFIPWYWTSQMWTPFSGSCQSRS